MISTTLRRRLEVVRKLHCPGEALDKWLAVNVTNWGLTETAQHIGVSRATLNYWLLSLGVEMRRVALAPGETLEVRR